MWLKLRWSILLVSAIAAATAVSIFSGYSSFDPGREVLWQISPLGLAFDFDPFILRWPSSCYFAGHYGADYAYLAAYLKTCLLEFPFFLILLKESGIVRSMAICSLANICTHPIIFFLVPCLFDRYFSALLASEVFAPVIEIAVVLVMENFSQKKFLPVRPTGTVLLIIAANLFSWQIGLFL